MEVNQIRVPGLLTLQVLRWGTCVSERGYRKREIKKLIRNGVPIYRLRIIKAQKLSNACTAF